MRLGVVFPQTEITADPGAVRAYAIAAEEAGYSHLLAYDHVLGAHPDRPNWAGRYDHEALFHEPFTLFAHLAAITSSIEFVTGVLVLPQRQTALVAKQAAEVDILSRGRLRLGVGIGWNDVEYEALGENFRNRGRRIEEQISLLRRLWTDPIVDFEGRYHRIDRAGLNPLPPRGASIPIWIGGRADPVLERTGRIGDGWFPLRIAIEDVAGYIARIHEAAEAAGRDPASIGIEGQVSIGRDDQERAIEEAHRWIDIGATHLTVNTMGAGFATPADHIEAIEHFKHLYDSAVLA
jgi:probable F420-dependent oxidoreductase